MARLPTPGSDNGTWGDILNDYLNQTHTADGTLKDNTVGTAQLQDNAVTTSALAADAVTNAEIADGTIQEAKLATPVQTKLNQAAPTWSTLSGKPAVVAAGATQVAARSSIDIGSHYVRFIDQNGNPLPTGSTTTIRVNTVTGEIDDITFEGVQ